MSRSKGRSATAAAAYRSGSAIECERTGERHDYTKKSGVEHSQIILPEGADGRLLDRSVLWNEAEKSETRKNSTVAREYEVGLPAELSADQRQALAADFGEWLAERYGVGVDICIHAPGCGGDTRNHHAHVLTTTRRIEGCQLTTKTRDLDDKKTGAIEEVREKWAELVNERLEQAKSVERVDHRSHERRGLEEAPTIHEGPAVTHEKRRGRAKGRAIENLKIREANAFLRSARLALKNAYEAMRNRLRPGQTASAPDVVPIASESAPKKRGLLGALRAGSRSVDAERESRLGKPLAKAFKTIDDMEKGRIPPDQKAYLAAARVWRKHIQQSPELAQALKPEEERQMFGAAKALKNVRGRGR